MEGLRSIWLFIQDQVLGMKWLNQLIGNGLSWIGLDVSGRIGGSIQFFIYDVTKIVVLLCALIFMISYIQSYFRPNEAERSWEDFTGSGRMLWRPCLGPLRRFVPVLRSRSLSDLRVPDCR